MVRTRTNGDRFLLTGLKSRSSVPPIGSTRACITAFPVPCEGVILTLGFEMKYQLIQKLLDAAPPIDITERQLDALRFARVCVLQALAVEEKYTLLFRNYLEIEREMHRITLELLLMQDDHHNRMLDGLRDMNRVFMNLLTAQKAYVDQVPQHINRICGPKSEESARFSAKTRDEFDGYLGYRVLAALRNHAQHQDLPIHSLVHIGQRDKSGESSVLVNGLSATCDRDELLLNEKLSGAARAAIVAQDAKFDVLPLIRQCMSSFSRLQLYVRETLRDRAGASDVLLADTHERFRTHAQATKLFGLHAAKVSDDGAEAESFVVTTNITERRKRLEGQTSTYTNLETFVISNEQLD